MTVEAPDVRVEAPDVTVVLPPQAPPIVNFPVDPIVSAIRNTRDTLNAALATTRQSVKSDIAGQTATLHRDLLGVIVSKAAIQGSNVSGDDLGRLRTFVRNLSGFQAGTPFVPATALFQLHRGEAVIPAHLNPFGQGSGNFGGDTNITINIGRVDNANTSEVSQLTENIAQEVLRRVQVDTVRRERFNQPRVNTGLR